MGRSPQNRLRIIGGHHRGRKLAFPDLPGLRPTGDRVRETLFNWLAPVIDGARCLDPFAGSGALALEAASRGAGRVVMLDRARVAVQQLEANVRTLGLTNAEVIQADALEWLQGPSRPFDIVFLDPPFADRLLRQACDLLLNNGWLDTGALVYLEADAKTGIPRLSEGLEPIREKRAGQVVFGLVRSADG